MTDDLDEISTYLLTQPFILWTAHGQATTAPSGSLERGGQAGLSRSDPDQAALRQDTKPRIYRLSTLFLAARIGALIARRAPYDYPPPSSAPALLEGEPLVL